MKNCKANIFGLLVVLTLAVGCSSSEEEVSPNQPNQPADPTKYTFDVKELVVESSQILRLGHQVDYAFIGGYDYRLYCEFKYKDRVIFLDMFKPRAYDSAKTVNSMMEIVPGIVATDVDIDTLTTPLASGPYISGVIFDEFEPFTIRVDVIKGTQTAAEHFPGLEKITIKVNPGVPFYVRVRTHLANEKFYAEYWLKYPKEFPELFNERIKVFTGRKMHINGLVFVD